MQLCIRAVPASKWLGMAHLWERVWLCLQMGTGMLHCHPPSNCYCTHTHAHALLLSQYLLPSCIPLMHAFRFAVRFTQKMPCKQTHFRVFPFLCFLWSYEASQRQLIICCHCGAEMKHLRQAFLLNRNLCILKTAGSQVIAHKFYCPKGKRGVYLCDFVRKKSLWCIFSMTLAKNYTNAKERTKMQERWFFKLSGECSISCCQAALGVNWSWTWDLSLFESSFTNFPCKTNAFEKNAFNFERKFQWSEKEYIEP